MKLVGPLYQRQNPCQSGGVAVVVGTRVVATTPRRRKRPQQPSQTIMQQNPHVDAPGPAPIPTPKSAIGAPKPKPPATLDEMLDIVLQGEERVTVTGTVVRK